MAIETKRPAANSTPQQTAVAVLAAISICHLLNDVIQSLIVALYPMIKDTLALDFRQIGLITFTFTFTASLLQPVVGYVTDRHPTPYSLVAGMGCSLLGLLIAAFASTYGLVLVAVGLIGMGSSVFHPESSRVARLASGGQHGLAQSVFQVGGNFGTALGPLLAAFVVLRTGLAGDETLARSLQEHVKATIAPYKYPRAVTFVEQLPKTATGKIQRFRIREGER